jgi:hypothetical protein
MIRRGNKPVPESEEARMSFDGRSPVDRRNRKIKRAFGIRDVQWLRNYGTTAVWRVSFVDRESLIVELPHFGTTESSVLRKVVEQLSATRKVRMA